MSEEGNSQDVFNLLPTLLACFMLVDYFFSGMEPARG